MPVHYHLLLGLENNLYFISCTKKEKKIGKCQKRIKHQIYKVTCKLLLRFEKKELVWQFRRLEFNPSSGTVWLCKRSRVLTFPVPNAPAKSLLKQVCV